MANKSMLRNKKAAMLLYMATIALVIASFTFLTIKVMEKPSKWEPKYIGEHQIALIKTAVNANKLLLYIDQSADSTTIQSIYNLGQKGGFSSGSSCGKYFEYEVWRNTKTKGDSKETENCFPAQETIKYDLADALNNELYRYLNVYWGKAPVESVASTTQIGYSAPERGTTPDQKTDTKKGSDQGAQKNSITGGAVMSPRSSCQPIQRVSGLKTDDFMRMYGSSEEEVGKNLEKVDFLGKNLRVHKKIAPALKCAVEDMKKCSEATAYKINSIGSFNWRMMVGSSTSRSLHSWAIAIDINPSANPYGKTLVTDLPNCMVESFKRYGFRWGGDFRSIKDAMHFEFRGDPDSVGTVAPGTSTQPIPAFKMPPNIKGPQGILGKILPGSYEVGLEQQKEILKVTALAQEDAEFDIILGPITKKGLVSTAGEAITQTIKSTVDKVVDIDGCEIEKPTVDSKSKGSPSSGKLENAASLPIEGPYLVLSPHARKRNRNYGTTELVIGMQKWGCALKKAYGIKMLFADMSAKNGGDISLHASHESGRDVDLGIIFNDNGRRTMVMKSATSGKRAASNYDAEANWFLMKSMVTYSNVKYIGLDSRLSKPSLEWAKNHNEDPEMISKVKSKLRSWTNHHHHYHIRINCPEGDSECRS
ncbi:penicillin-insensitive murein endopeptidase [candidate division KSB1 bacterium]